MCMTNVMRSMLCADTKHLIFLGMTCGTHNSTTNNNLSSDSHNVSHENTGLSEDRPLISCCGVAHVLPIESYRKLNGYSSQDVFSKMCNCYPRNLVHLFHYYTSIKIQLLRLPRCLVPGVFCNLKATHPSIT